MVALYISQSVFYVKKTTNSKSATEIKNNKFSINSLALMIRTQRLKVLGFISIYRYLYS